MPSVAAITLALVTLAAGWLGATGAASAAPTRVNSLEQVRALFPQERYALVDGVSIHYRDEGKGPVLLLVHGTFGDLQDWNEWTRALVGEMRVLRIDLPGAGLTGPIANGNYSVDRILSLIDGFTDSLSIDRFAIGGVSFGGLVAFRYAATRTERVTALLLANSAGIEFGGRGGTQARRSQPLTGYNILTDESVKRPDVEKFLHYLINDESRVTDDLVERKLAFANIAGRGEEGATGSRLYERGTPQRVLGHVRAPVLVLWSTANPALSTETANAFVSALTNARSVELKFIEGGGHMLNLDRPAQTVAEVRAFLARQSLEPPSSCARDAPLARPAVAR